MIGGMKLLRIFLTAAILAAAIPAAVADGPAIRFGVVSGESETLDGVNLAALASYLGRSLGVAFEAVSYPGHQALMDALGKNDVQVALFIPAAYVKCAKLYPSAGVEPVAKVASRGEAAVGVSVIVPVDSDIRAPADLAGAVFGTGGPYSLSTSLVPLAMLRRAGVAPRDTVRFASSDALADAVVAGGCAAAGLPRFRAEPLTREEEVRVIARDQAHASEPVCVNKHVDAARAAAIREALLALGSDATGERVLKAVNPRLTGFEPAAPGDYDSVRQLITEIHGDRFYHREPPPDNP